MIDISLPLDGSLMVWPGNPRVELIPVKRLARGDDADVSEVRMSSHAGTHLDLPGHTIPGGVLSESLDLDVLVGPAHVVDLGSIETEIGVEDLEGHVSADVRRLLLKTRNSELWGEGPASFPDSYVALSVEAARWLAERGVLLVGIDFLSIERRGAVGRPVHRTLLGAGLAVLEGIDLRNVPPGAYQLVCLPLRLVGSDGAPARAILLSTTEA